MKPWYEFTFEEDLLLYDEPFDLEAVLRSPTPTGGTPEPAPEESLQEVSGAPVMEPPSPPEESLQEVSGAPVMEPPPPPEESLHEISGAPITEPPSPPMESLQVQELRKQLATLKAQLDDQVQVNESQERRLKTQERLANQKDLELKEVKLTLKNTENKLQDQITAYKEIRYLYNTSVRDSVSLKQELAGAKRKLSERKEPTNDQGKAKEHQMNTQRSASTIGTQTCETMSNIAVQEEPAAPVMEPPSPPEESLQVQEIRQQLTTLKAQLDDQVRVIKSQECRLKTQERLANQKDLELKLTLKNTENKLQDQITAYKEIRYLYNTSVRDSVSLKQELAVAKRKLSERKEPSNDQVKAKEHQSQVPRVSVSEPERRSASTLGTQTCKMNSSAQKNSKDQMTELDHRLKNLNLNMEKQRRMQKQ